MSLKLMKKVEEKNIALIVDAENRLRRSGGKVWTTKKRFSMPTNPGLKLWSAHDTLMNYGGYICVDEESWKNLAKDTDVVFAAFASRKRKKGEQDATS